MLCSCTIPASSGVGLTEGEFIDRYGAPKAVQTRPDGTKELIYVFERMETGPWQPSATEETDYRGDVVAYTNSLSKEWNRQSGEAPVRISKFGRVVEVPQGTIVRH